MAESDQITLSTRRRIGLGTSRRNGLTPGEARPRQTSPKQPALGRRLSGAGGKRPVFRASKGSGGINSSKAGGY